MSIHKREAFACFKGVPLALSNSERCVRVKQGTIFSPELTFRTSQKKFLDVSLKKERNIESRQLYPGEYTLDIIPVSHRGHCPYIFLHYWPSRLGISAQLSLYSLLFDTT